MSRSDEDDSDKEESTVESLEGSNDDSSSSEKEGSSVPSAECNDFESTHKGADVLLNIHDQLDLDKLQKVPVPKRFNDEFDAQGFTLIMSKHQHAIWFSCTSYLPKCESS